MDFKDKTVVVTGGSLGIGRAISEFFGRTGARVAICSRSEEDLNRTAGELSDAGMTVFHQPCDVSDRSQVDDFVAAVEERFGPVHVLVNNAGIGGPNPIGSPETDTWSKVLAVTLDGSFFCSRAVLAKMPDQGRIINFSSVLGKFGVPGYTAYCTAKHGIIGFTRALALETASRKITVNAVCPGWVETRMAEQGMEAGAQAAGTTYEEFRARSLAHVPLREIIQPDEIASLVGFLASPEAGNITGQAYNICGGQVMH